jgi:topoisomerase-4 subunit A
MSEPAAPAPPAGGDIRTIGLGEALAERYLAYALSTITARSLPDVRDGLKPVQRRLLHAMRELGLDPASGFKKCARVVGDVIGKFHPHGDVPVYEALVRLAQAFAQRYPLVDGQGNFGNVDGDNAAAMRYTEARLSAVATALLDGIDEDTVDFRPTYDGSEREPVVLPAAFPNLLANGAAGIAVGMATSIPPHHAGELLDALVWMLGRPAEAPLPAADELVRFVPGPDLPTGGVLVEPAASIAQAYATGRGSFRLRARWVREDLGYGQYQIVVTEIPYQVAKGRLVERLAELLAQKKLPAIQDVRDESADTIRLVLVPRSRAVPPEPLMEQLFRSSDLETRVPLNLNVLDHAGVPRVMSLAEALQAFLDHRMDVLARRSRHRLAKIADRLEVLDGYLKAFLDLDRVIEIIRREDEPKPVLMVELTLSERQAEAVLNLRLRQLRRLEEVGLREEAKALAAERDGLDALLADEALRRARLVEELSSAKARHVAGPSAERRTALGAAPVLEAEVVELPVERWPATVVLSEQGWIRALRGHVESTADIRYKEGDGERLVLRAQSSDRLLLLTADGRAFTLPVDRLPSGRGQGEPVGLLAGLAKGVEIVACRIARGDGRLVVATRQGRGFVVPEAAILAQTRAGRQVVNLAGDDRLVVVRPVEGELVAVSATSHRLLVFDLAELPVLERGRGVLLMRLKDAALADLVTFTAEHGLSWQAGERRSRVAELLPWRGKRAGSGREAPRGFPKDHRFGRSVGGLAQP